MVGFLSFIIKFILAPLPVPNMPFQNVSRAQTLDKIYLSYNSGSKRKYNEILTKEVSPIRQIELEYQMANENYWYRLDYLIPFDVNEIVIDGFALLMFIMLF